MDLWLDQPRKVQCTVRGGNRDSGLRGLPRFAEGIYWAPGLSLTTPFTEGSVTDIYHTIPYHTIPGARELITKPHPLAVIRNRRLNSVALLNLAPLRSVQFSSDSILPAVSKETSKVDIYVM